MRVSLCRGALCKHVEACRFRVKALKPRKGEGSFLHKYSQQCRKPLNVWKAYELGCWLANIPTLVPSRIRTVAVLLARSLAWSPTARSFTHITSLSMSLSVLFSIWLSSVAVGLPKASAIHPIQTLCNPYEIPIWYRLRQSRLKKYVTGDTCSEEPWKSIPDNYLQKKQIRTIWPQHYLLVVRREKGIN